MSIDMGVELPKSPQTIPELLSENGIQILLSLACLVFFIGKAFSTIDEGLSLDEFGTWWVINDSFQASGERALRIQGQSPLYYQALYVWTSLLESTAERSLRMLSLVFGIIFLCTMWFFLSKTADTTVATIGILLAVLNKELGIVYSIARPYCFALTFALLAIAFGKSRRSSGIISPFCSGFFAALTVLSHYLFGLIIPCVLYHLMVIERLPAKSILIFCAAAILPISFFFMQISELYLRKNSLSFWYIPEVADLVKILSTSEIKLSFMIFLVFLCLSKIDRSYRFQLKTPLRYLKLFILIFLFPPIVLFSVSRFFDIGLLVPRYYSLYLIGMICLSANLLALKNKFNPLIVAGFIVLLKFFLFPVQQEVYSEGFKELKPRETIAEQAGCTVLLSPGFVETLNPNSIEDAYYRGFFSAPLQYFLPEVTPLILPLNPSSIEAREYLREKVRPLLASSPCLTVFARENSFLINGIWTTFGIHNFREIDAFPDFTEVSTKREKKASVTYLRRSVRME